MSDASVVLSETGEVELSDGTVVLLEELRLRQFLRLLRIVTEGTPPSMLVDGLATLGQDEGGFGANLMLLVMLGIPNAEDAVVDFIASMIRPKGLVGGPDGKPKSALTKQEIERDRAAYDELARKIENPHLEDVVILVEAIFRQSAGDFEALGKRLAAMFAVAQKTGMLKS